MNKSIFLLSITFLIATVSFTQTSDYKHQIGVSFKASTNGFGGDIYYRPMKKFAIKAGGEYLSLNIKSKTLERYVGESVNIKIDIPKGNVLSFSNEGKFKTGSLTLAIGYQPFKALYFTAGIGKYLFQSDVTGVPITDLTFASKYIPDIGTVTRKILKDNIGDFNIIINPSNSIVPYIGIGLGSFVPQNKRYSFALELGAYYVGNYVLKSNSPSGFNIKDIDYGGAFITQEQKDQLADIIKTEINSVVKDLNTEVNTAVNDINKKIEPYKFYPVLKLTIGFRVLEFKRK